MTAELLRRAADLMRERAAYTDKGPWARRGSDCQCCDDIHAAGGWLMASGVDAINAEHIASWHPAVALAVADWLESVHVNLDTYNATRPESLHAFAVARAYLDESS